MNGLRCAYVEMNFFHGEIQPTFWWVAHRAGVEVDFHLLRPNAALEPLAGLAEAPRIVPIDVPDPHDPCARPLGDVEFLDPDRYDLVILGTAEPADRPAALRPAGAPQLHVVHNLTDGVAAEPGVTPCVLAPHAGDRLVPPAVVIEPFHLGDLGSAGDVSTVPDEGPLIVCVPGTVQLRRRNYGALVRALVELRDEGVTPDELAVRLVGRAFGREAHLRGRVRFSGERLQEALRDAGVEHYVELSPRELTYPELYDQVGRSHFFLPLVDDCFVHSRRYLLGKHTSAIGVGIGAGVVPILNERHAEVLGIDVGLRYRLDDVASGLRAALTCEDLGVDRAEVAAFRDRRLEQSARSFADWLERVA